jgi:hypothetical protein
MSAANRRNVVIKRRAYLEWRKRLNARLNFADFFLPMQRASIAVHQACLLNGENKPIALGTKAGCCFVIAFQISLNTVGVVRPIA